MVETICRCRLQAKVIRNYRLLQQCQEDTVLLQALLHHLTVTETSTGPSQHTAKGRPCHPCKSQPVPRPTTSTPTSSTNSSRSKTSPTGPPTAGTISTIPMLPSLSAPKVWQKSVKKKTVVSLKSKGMRFQSQPQDQQNPKDQPQRCHQPQL